MKYRPDIDGLRACAVLPVVLFHMGVPAITGGFVGVDVFFVISGYVISRQLLEALNSGTFSLLNFYERRVRRIFPALLFIVALTTVFAWLLLLPPQMLDFSDSLLASAFFISNFFFWRQSGYFDIASAFRPLLHLWSLAVEEQFYILMPVAIYVILCTWFAVAVHILGWVLGLFGIKCGAHKHRAVRQFLFVAFARVGASVGSPACPDAAASAEPYDC